MGKHTIRDTSKEAYKQVSQKMLHDHWGKILFAMRLLGIACSSEAIAKKAGMDRDQSYRRMGELVNEGLVYVSGTGVTSRGRQCALYSLTTLGKEKQEANAASQSKLQSEKQSLIQKELFQ